MKYVLVFVLVCWCDGALGLGTTISESYWAISALIGTGSPVLFVVGFVQYTYIVLLGIAESLHQESKIPKV